MAVTLLDDLVEFHPRLASSINGRNAGLTWHQQEKHLAQRGGSRVTAPHPSMDLVLFSIKGLCQRDMSSRSVPLLPSGALLCRNRDTTEQFPLMNELPVKREVSAESPRTGIVMGVSLQEAPISGGRNPNTNRYLGWPLCPTKQK